MKISTLFRSLFVSAGIAALAACNSTAIVDVPAPEAQALTKNSQYEINRISSNDSGAPNSFLLSVTDHLEAELKRRGMLAGDGGRSVTIDLLSYRMRRGAIRGFFGAWAGHDGIKSSVVVSSPGIRELVSRATVMTNNLTIYSDADQIAKRHAVEIADYLSGS
jgi:hypothetical protein